MAEAIIKGGFTKKAVRIAEGAMAVGVGARLLGYLLFFNVHGEAFDRAMALLTVVGGLVAFGGFVLLDLV